MNPDTAGTMVSPLWPLNTLSSMHLQLSDAYISKRMEHTLASTYTSSIIISVELGLDQQFLLSLFSLFVLMAGPTQEACLVVGIAAVGLVYMVLMLIEAVGSSRVSLLLPDHCCFPTQHLMTIDGVGGASPACGGDER
ncbi:hypothetical protein OPV22_032689 [Ensete ventricosum]|uniref:Uncharacterized protein n=1 Tax=Ensete ventricosum TaxID=4639 RepID=A0AAV8PS07_ENSVE|nr:hypothetical protein OPV22_032689 [Ensete ventricosum]